MKHTVEHVGNKLRILQGEKAALEYDTEATYYASNVSMRGDDDEIDGRIYPQVSAPIVEGRVIEVKDVYPTNPPKCLLHLRLSCGSVVQIKSNALAKTRGEAYENAKRDVSYKIAILAKQLTEATDFYEHIDQMSLDNKGRLYDSAFNIED